MQVITEAQKSLDYKFTIASESAFMYFLPIFFFMVMEMARIFFPKLPPLFVALFCPSSPQSLTASTSHICY